MSTLTRQIRRVIAKPLVFKSPDTVWRELVQAGTVKDDARSLRRVEDAMRDDVTLIRISDGRYALRTSVRRQGTLTVRCAEILAALGNIAPVEDISLFVPENAHAVSNALSGGRFFRRVARGTYRLVTSELAVARQVQTRRNRNAITDAPQLDQLSPMQRATLALISLGRPGSPHELLSELERLELEPLSLKALEAALGEVERAESSGDGCWRLTHTYYQYTSHAERLELALACFRRPALSREIAAWLQARGCSGDARTVKDAFERSRITERLAQGVYAVPGYEGQGYQDIVARVAKRLAAHPHGASIRELARELDLDPKLVEVVLKTHPEVTRSGGAYRYGPPSQVPTTSRAQTLLTVIAALPQPVSVTDALAAVRDAGLPAARAEIRDLLAKHPACERRRPGVYALEKAA